METSKSKNPKRVEAGRRNRQLRGPLSQAGLERLRATAIANRPWARSTGPRTEAGKAVVAKNGEKNRNKQTQLASNQIVANAKLLLRQMKSIREQLYLEPTNLEFRQAGIIATELAESLFEANELLTKNLVGSLRSDS